MTTSSKTLPATFVAWARTRPAGQTIGYYLAFVALGLAGAVLGPTLPGLAEHTHTRLSQISYLFTARSLGYLLGSFLSGRLYDRRPGHLLMGGMLVVLGATLALVPVVPILWLLAACVLMLGLAEGAVDVGGNTLIVWVHGEKVGPFMNALHFFFGIGAFLSPIIVAQVVLASGNITWAYWILAFLMLPPFVWLLRTPSPPSPVAAHAEGSIRVEPLVLFLVCLFLYLYVGAEVGFGGWISTYAISQGMTAATAAYVASAFWGSFTAGRLLSIPLATRVRPSRMLLGDLLGCLAGAGIILLWPGSMPALWLGTVIAGFSMASIFPTTITFAGTRMTITGKVTGWFLVGSSLGGMTLPWLIGQLFETVGPEVVMYFIAGSLILGLGVLALLKRLTPRRSKS